MLLCISFSIGARPVVDCNLTTLVGHGDLEVAIQMNMMCIRAVSVEHCGDIQAVLCCFILSQVCNRMTSLLSVRVSVLAC